ncbi:2-thiouracil desulfurase family protein [Enterococcus sp. LJL99]
MIGISACLGGICCRYDGGSKGIKELEELVAEQKALMVCPEVLGGLSTPRDPAEIDFGDGFDVWQNEARVLTINGEDVTEAYKDGAKKAYSQLNELKITKLIMKDRSPSCGSQQIYDGSFSGGLKIGVGVATAYFINQGIKIYSEANWQEVISEEDLNG